MAADNKKDCTHPDIIPVTTNWIDTRNAYYNKGVELKLTHLLHHAILIDDKFIPAYEAIIEMFVDENNIRQALKYCDRLDAVSREVAFILKGQIYFSCKRYVESSEAFDCVLKMNSGFTKAFFYRALQGFFLKNYDDSVLYIGKYLTTHPNDYYALLCFAASKLFLRDFEVALDAFQRLLRQKKDSFVLNYLTALCHFMRRNCYDFALTYTNKALSIKEHNKYALFLKAVIFHITENDELKNAIDTRALKNDAYKIKCLLLLAASEREKISHLSDEYYERVLKIYDQCQSVIMNYDNKANLYEEIEPLILSKLITLYERDQNNENVYTELLRVLKKEFSFIDIKNCKNSNLVYFVGFIHMKVFEDTEAAVYLDRALELDAKNPHYYIAKLIFLTRKNQYSQALHLLETAILACQFNEMLYYYHAHCLVHENKSEEALIVISKLNSPLGRVEEWAKVFVNVDLKHESESSKWYFETDKQLHKSGLSYEIRQLESKKLKLELLRVECVVNEYIYFEFRNANFLLFKAYYEFYQKNYQNAIEYLTEALSINNQSCGIKCMLGLCYLHCCNPDEAATYLAGVLKVNNSLSYENYYSKFAAEYIAKNEKFLLPKFFSALASYHMNDIKRAEKILTELIDESANESEKVSIFDTLFRILHSNREYEKLWIYVQKAENISISRDDKRLELFEFKIIIYKSIVEFSRKEYAQCHARLEKLVKSKYFIFLAQFYYLVSLKWKTDKNSLHNDNTIAIKQLEELLENTVKINLYQTPARSKEEEVEHMILSDSTISLVEVQFHIAEGYFKDKKFKKCFGIFKELKSKIGNNFTFTKDDFNYFYALTAYRVKDFDEAKRYLVDLADEELNENDRNPNINRKIIPYYLSICFYRLKDYVRAFYEFQKVDDKNLDVDAETLKDGKTNLNENPSFLRRCELKCILHLIIKYSKDKIQDKVEFYYEKLDKLCQNIDENAKIFSEKILHQKYYYSIIVEYEIKKDYAKGLNLCRRAKDKFSTDTNFTYYTALNIVKMSLITKDQASLNESINCFEQVYKQEMHMNTYTQRVLNTFYYLGRIQQILSKHDAALDWFLRIIKSLDRPADREPSEISVCLISDEYTENDLKFYYAESLFKIGKSEDAKKELESIHGKLRERLMSLESNEQKSFVATESVYHGVNYYLGLIKYAETDERIKMAVISGNESELKDLLDTIIDHFKCALPSSDYKSVVEFYLGKCSYFLDTTVDYEQSLNHFKNAINLDKDNENEKNMMLTKILYKVALKKSQEGMPVYAKKLLKMSIDQCETALEQLNTESENEEPIKKAYDESMNESINETYLFALNELKDYKTIIAKANTLLAKYPLKLSFAVVYGIAKFNVAIANINEEAKTENRKMILERHLAKSISKVKREAENKGAEGYEEALKTSDENFFVYVNSKSIWGKYLIENKGSDTSKNEVKEQYLTAKYYLARIRQLDPLINYEESVRYLLQIISHCGYINSLRNTGNYTNKTLEDYVKEVLDNIVVDELQKVTELCREFSMKDVLYYLAQGLIEIDQTSQQFFNFAIKVSNIILELHDELKHDFTDNDINYIIGFCQFRLAVCTQNDNEKYKVCIGTLKSCIYYPLSEDNLEKSLHIDCMIGYSLNQRKEYQEAIQSFESVKNKASKSHLLDVDEIDSLFIESCYLLACEKKLSNDVYAYKQYFSKVVELCNNVIQTSKVDKKTSSSELNVYLHQAVKRRLMSLFFIDEYSEFTKRIEEAPEFIRQNDILLVYLQIVVNYKKYITEKNTGALANCDLLNKTHELCTFYIDKNEKTSNIKLLNVKFVNACFLKKISLERNYEIVIASYEEIENISGRAVVNKDESCEEKLFQSLFELNDVLYNLSLTFFEMKKYDKAAEYSGKLKDQIADFKNIKYQNCIFVWTASKVQGETYLEGLEKEFESIKNECEHFNESRFYLAKLYICTKDKNFQKAFEIFLNIDKEKLKPELRFEKSQLMVVSSFKSGLMKLEMDQSYKHYFEETIKSCNEVYAHYTEDGENKATFNNSTLTEAYKYHTYALYYLSEFDKINELFKKEELLTKFPETADLYFYAAVSDYKSFERMKRACSKSKEKRDLLRFIENDRYNLSNEAIKQLNLALESFKRFLMNTSQIMRQNNHVDEDADHIKQRYLTTKFFIARVLEESCFKKSDEAVRYLCEIVKHDQYVSEESRRDINENVIFKEKEIRKYIENLLGSFKPEDLSRTDKYREFTASDVIYYLSISLVNLECLPDNLRIAFEVLKKIHHGNKSSNKEQYSFNDIQYALGFMKFRLGVHLDKVNKPAENIYKEALEYLNQCTYLADVEPEKYEHVEFMKGYCFFQESSYDEAIASLKRIAKENTSFNIDEINKLLIDSYYNEAESRRIQANSIYHVLYHDTIKVCDKVIEKYKELSTENDFTENFYFHACQKKIHSLFFMNKYEDLKTFYTDKMKAHIEKETSFLYLYILVNFYENQDKLTSSEFDPSEILDDTKLYINNHNNKNSQNNYLSNVKIIRAVVLSQKAAGESTFEPAILLTEAGNKYSENVAKNTLNDVFDKNRIRFYLAVVYFKLEKHEDVLTVMSDVVQENLPEKDQSFNGFIKTVSSYILGRNMEQVEGELINATHESKLFVEANYFLGKYYYHKKNFVKSAACFEKIIGRTAETMPLPKDEMKILCIISFYNAALYFFNHKNDKEGRFQLQKLKEAILKDNTTEKSKELTITINIYKSWSLFFLKDFDELNKFLEEIKRDEFTKQYFDDLNFLLGVCTAKGSKSVDLKTACSLLHNYSTDKTLNTTKPKANVSSNTQGPNEKAHSLLKQILDYDDEKTKKEKQLSAKYYTGYLEFCSKEYREAQKTFEGVLSVILNSDVKRLDEATVEQAVRSNECIMIDIGVLFSDLLEVYFEIDKLNLSVSDATERFNKSKEFIKTLLKVNDRNTIFNPSNAYYHEAKIDFAIYSDKVAKSETSENDLELGKSFIEKFVSIIERDDERTYDAVMCLCEFYLSNKNYDMFKKYYRLFQNKLDSEINNETWKKQNNKLCKQMSLLNVKMHIEKLRNDPNASTKDERQSFLELTDPNKPIEEEREMCLLGRFNVLLVTEQNEHELKTPYDQLKAACSNYQNNHEFIYLRASYEFKLKMYDDCEESINKYINLCIEKKDKNNEMKGRLEKIKVAKIKGVLLENIITECELLLGYSGNSKETTAGVYYEIMQAYFNGCKYKECIGKYEEGKQKLRGNVFDDAKYCLANYMIGLSKINHNEESDAAVNEYFEKYKQLKNKTDVDLNVVHFCLAVIYFKSGKYDASMTNADAIERSSDLTAQSDFYSNLSCFVINLDKSEVLSKLLKSLSSLKSPSYLNSFLKILIDYEMTLLGDFQYDMKLKNKFASHVPEKPLKMGNTKTHLTPLNFENIYHQIFFEAFGFYLKQEYADSIKHFKRFIKGHKSADKLRTLAEFYKLVAFTCLAESNLNASAKSETFIEKIAKLLKESYASMDKFKSSMQLIDDGYWQHLRFFYIANAYFYLDEYESAQNYFEKLFDKKALQKLDLNLSRLRYSSCLFENEKYKDCMKVLGTLKNDQSVEILLAKCLFKQGSKDEALKIIDGVIKKLDKHKPTDVFYYRGLILFEQEMYKEALAAFNLQLQNQPQHCNALLHVAFCHEKLEDKTTSKRQLLELYDQAISNDLRHEMWYEKRRDLFKSLKGSDQKIFFSYNHKSSELVTLIVDLFTKLGFVIWFDKKDQRTGDRLVDSFLDGLRGSKVVVTFISSLYVDSVNCMLEIKEAHEKGIFIIPVFIDDLKTNKYNPVTEKKKYDTHEANWKQIDEVFLKGILYARMVSFENTSEIQLLKNEKIKDILLQLTSKLIDDEPTKTQNNS